MLPRWQLPVRLGPALALAAIAGCGDHPTPTAPLSEAPASGTIPELASGNARTHEFTANLPGYTEFQYSNQQPVGVLAWTLGKVKGFSNDGSMNLRIDQTGTGSFGGTFEAYRFLGGRNNSVTEYLYGTVSGTAYDIGTGITYLGVATITGGTGRLAGASGTISFNVYQHGYLDPAIFGNRVQADYVYEGGYTLP